MDPQLKAQPLPDVFSSAPVSREQGTECRVTSCMFDLSWVQASSLRFTAPLECTQHGSPGTSIQVLELGPLLQLCTFRSLIFPVLRKMGVLTRILIFNTEFNVLVEKPYNTQRECQVTTTMAALA